MPKQNHCINCQHCIPNRKTPYFNECALNPLKQKGIANPPVYLLCIGLNRNGLCKSFEAKDWDQALKNLCEQGK